MLRRALPPPSAPASIASCRSIWPASAARRSRILPWRCPRARQPGIPITYVPARNTMMLALALGWAEVLGATSIYIGVNAVDYSGYPDCRPEFIAAFEALAARATRAGVEGRPADHPGATDRLDQGADHPGRQRSSGWITRSPCPAIRRMPAGAPAAGATRAGSAATASMPPASPDPTRYV